MRYRPRQVCLCDPNRLLSSLPRFSAHCHARSLLPTVVNHSTIYDENPDLHHGLLGIAFANLYETVVAYAILYLLTMEIHNGSVCLHTRLEAAYFSLVTITT